MGCARVGFGAQIWAAAARGITWLNRSPARKHRRIGISLVMLTASVRLDDPAESFVGALVGSPILTVSMEIRGSFR
jgi:hypothetical protein